VNRYLHVTIRLQYGPGALALQFAQVGNDAKAEAFLDELDNHPVVGPMIDQTGNYEAEQEQMMRTTGIGKLDVSSGRSEQRLMIVFGYLCQICRR
jgi:hypothetical protein